MDLFQLCTGIADVPTVYWSSCFARGRELNMSDALVVVG